MCLICARPEGGGLEKGQNYLQRLMTHDTQLNCREGVVKNLVNFAGGIREQPLL